ncbi:MAG: hypothetical protein AB7O50_14150 [Pseudolabrys sp.]
MRRYRRLLMGEAAARAEEARKSAMQVVEIARDILKDPKFARTLKSQGISSAPSLLASAEMQSGRLADQTLFFAAVWAFFHPLLKNVIIATHLEKAWPSFTTQLKDAFIALVQGGPFPQPIAIFELNKLANTLNRRTEQDIRKKAVTKRRTRQAK